MTLDDWLAANCRYLAVALARRHPIGNVIVTALMIATWPLVLTWVKVRENWR